MNANSFAKVTQTVTVNALKALSPAVVNCPLANLAVRIFTTALVFLSNGTRTAGSAVWDYTQCIMGHVYQRVYRDCCSITSTLGG